MKVCIDAGHGAKDPGAILGKRYEKDDVLRLALALKPRLEAQGIGVVLTRSTDAEISIAERCVLANREKCAYFLSLHRDAAGAAAYGVSMWVHSRADAATTSKAQSILTEVLGVTPTYDRKVQKGAANPAWTDYGVNVQTNMASGLLELGFITNAEDNAHFDQYFDAYADAITRGLCKVLGVSHMPPMPPVSPPEPNTVTFTRKQWDALFDAHMGV